MSDHVRSIVAVLGGIVLLAVVIVAFAHLPDFGIYLGPYGTILNTVAQQERHIPNVTTAVNFDYRGLDTMGEEFILFAAVAGLTLVLRRDRAEATDDPLPGSHGRGSGTRTDAVEAFSLLGASVTAAFGIYMAIHPHLTPGGGFQGGAITAGFAALLFLGVGYRPFKALTAQEVVEPMEAIGAAGYVVVGLATLAAAGAFLANSLPLGPDGALFSTGTIPVINACVALEVIAGFVLVFSEFADETRIETGEKEEGR